MAKEPEKRPADGGVLLRRLEAIRRKRDRREMPPTVDAVRPATEAPADATGKGRTRPGPVTLMSRLMRRGVGRKDGGGPGRLRFLRPLVLLALLAIVIGVIVWAFWPPGEEQLYQRGAAAAASPNPDDWDRAVEAFDALDHDHPNHPYRKEVDDLRRRAADRDAARSAARAARPAGPRREAQWFFQVGMRQGRRGNAAAARQRWKALTQAFGRTPEDAPWVDLANKELQRLDDGEVGERQWAPVRAAVQKAKQLRKDGKADEANAIVEGLWELYRGDAEAEAILKE